MTSPSSLRDLYIDPSNAWAFVPPSPNAPKPNATSVSPPEPVGQAYQFSTRPTRNSIFELSPSLDLDEHSGINTAQLFKTVVASAVLQYTSSALVNPWEVGKLLLQVQWVPRDAGEPQAEEEIVNDAKTQFSDSENDESYFADPHAATAPRRYPAPRPTDEQGYVIRRSVLEEGTRPEYILPVGCVDGVWNMIKRIGRFRFEGWLALWKGLATSTLTEMAYTSMQPLVNQFLQSLFLPSMSPFHQPPLFLTVASHVIAGFFLSPLDLIRTRLVVQSFTSRYRTYTGPFNALHKILRDEGGLRGIYFHPNLLIPTLLDSALRPIVSLALPGIIASYFGASHITEATHPVAWGCAELASSCIGLLITLPIETIRRRLQVQVRGSAESMKGCVELRPAPYNGVVDAFWHILTEERSDLPITHRPRRRRNSKSARSKDGDKEEKEDTYDDEPESIWKNTGLGQLYHGLGMRLGASAIYFFLNLFVSPEETDAGWVEI
ncbi:Mitochondrial fusion and transport protein ugo1 [Leucoagaricus sp. SymC.cos]|nr:Mitochondrial fusion and transport protein ugo1 [Leucoagaricus sp. SymC.cos]